MDLENKGPAPLTGEPGQINSLMNHSTAPHKWKRVLAALASGKSFIRFEAEADLHDHCLHTTVADLQAKRISILRRYEKAPGFAGIETKVKRYWIEPTSIPRAHELLSAADIQPPSGFAIAAQQLLER